MENQKTWSKNRYGKKHAACRFCRWTPLLFISIVALTCVISSKAQSPEKLSEEQKRDFLLNAEIVGSKRIGRGTTGAYRLTLSNGSVGQDASFQSIDKYKPYVKFPDGTRETNFRDSYKYNIAAFELAKLLGIADMIPVTVERNWKGKTGSLSWWLPSKMDEGQRMKKRLSSPDPQGWNKQMHKIRVFVELVYDTDRNEGNILISEDWHVWMIDFTRAFRTHKTLKDPRNLVHCDRSLLQKLQELEATELERKAGRWLNGAEIEGVMARRDKIVAHLQGLIADQGESSVLYD
jgi:hypothetical protein